MQIDESYYEAKNQVIKAERRMLKDLGFCVHVKHPHKVHTQMNDFENVVNSKKFNYFRSFSFICKRSSSTLTWN